MTKKVNLRDFPSAQKRREFLEKKLSIKLDDIANFSFPEDQAVGRNIENLIGATQIPLGIASPLRIRSEFVIATPDSIRGKQSSSEREIAASVEDSLLAMTKSRKIASSQTPRNDNKSKEYYIPLATTEGALVASISRGCKATTESGGINTYVENVGITRGPVFKLKNLGEAMRSEIWIEKNFKNLAKLAKSTSTHLKLLKADYKVVGRSLFVRFYFDTGDAMGMNMATIATEAMVKAIERETGAKCISLAGNFDVDKKPSWLNFILGRGKAVWAECVLSKKIVTNVLKVAPEEIIEVVEKKCHLGSMMSGSLGYNSHFANIAAAIFAATGQDLAHIAEASLGITNAEVLETGDLYFSIYLPSLIVGTVGGGTHLPTQQEALKIMKVSSVLEYAMVVGAAVLAGELSLIASLAEGSLAKAHKKLGRRQKIDVRG